MHVQNFCFHHQWVTLLGSRSLLASWTWTSVSYKQGQPTHMPTLVMKMTLHVRKTRYKTKRKIVKSSKALLIMHLTANHSHSRQNNNRISLFLLKNANAKWILVHQRCLPHPENNEEKNNQTSHFSVLISLIMIRHRSKWRRKKEGKFGMKQWWI